MKSRKKTQHNTTQHNGLMVSAQPFFAMRYFWTRPASSEKCLRDRRLAGCAGNSLLREGSGLRHRLIYAVLSQLHNHHPFLQNLAFAILIRLSSLNNHTQEHGANPSSHNHPASFLMPRNFAHFGVAVDGKLSKRSTHTRSFAC